MKTHQLALAAFLSASVQFTEAFTPHNLPNRIQTHSIAFTSSLSTSPVSSSQLNMSSMAFDDEDEEEEDDEDEEEEDEEEEDMDAAIRRRSYAAKSPFTGMKLDPYDPNPVIRRPGKFFKDEEERIPDDQLVQTMSMEERKENLQVMRQIRKNDLPDLQMRRDHAGWVEANNDLKRRVEKDPWFGVNERLKEAIQTGESDEAIDYLKDLASKVGGPPDGITVSANRGYAVHSQIYDIGISANAAQSMIEFEMRQERAARGRALMAERIKNQEKEQREYEEDMRFPGQREDREAKARRERVMKRLMSEIDEDKKKQKERAREMLGRDPDLPGSTTESLERALKAATDDVKKARRELLGGLPASTDDTDEDEETPTKKSSADRAREAAAAEAAGGRPRLPGDSDVTRGELGDLELESSSSTTTGPLTVEVSSTYNKEQSDPPMRKHCFQYTIRIRNNSEMDTIQLMGRRFEIQTVGSSMKDVVQGEGVTGRQPILKPGQTFEYTSTAPLSVRPIGTTIIAARMRGEYSYVTLQPGQETADADAVGDEAAELGTFHFIFPEDQRVVPFNRAEDEDDDEDEDEDDDDEPEPVKASKAATSTPAKTPSASPASTLPGDADMTSGDVAVSPLNDSSDTVTEDVRVQVSSSYRPERSDSDMGKHCFAYNIRITNESEKTIQLVSRRFEIQTVGSKTKDVVQGPGVTGRQPVLKPGESFEYTSTAPLSVRPMLEKTPVVARMEGSYQFVIMGDDGSTPISSSPLQAILGMFHFILPALDGK